MAVKAEYSAVSGFNLDRFCGIGLRFNDEFGFNSEEGESYLMGSMPGLFGHVLKQNFTWFTSVWYSPTDTVFLVEDDGEITRWPNFNQGKRESHKVNGVIMGVWGLRDDYVIAWGDRRGGSDSVMYRWDGSMWTEMPAPEVDCILSVHGIREDLIYAVGVNGYLARWDGVRWTPLPSGTSSVLSCVHVVSDDEMYACGPGGKLLQGTIHGWAELLSGPEMFSVAKWHDEVWVAANEAGLMKLKGNKLKCIKPNIKAMMLDAREDLVISMKTGFAVTSDEKTFKGVGIGYFEKHVTARPGMEELVTCAAARRSLTTSDC